MTAGIDAVKIKILLQRNDSGYPPADYEHLWARPVNPGLYEIDNIPFFARGLRVGDVVAATKDGQELVFSKLVRQSGHMTLRVIVFTDSPDGSSLQVRVETLRSTLSNLGCSTELSHIPGLLAVDVPPQVDFRDITTLLGTGEESGLWEYEEAALP